MDDKHVRSRMANTLKIMQDLIWLMNGTTDQLMFWAFIIAGCFETCSYITQYALNCFSINPKDTKKFDTLYYSHCRRHIHVLGLKKYFYHNVCWNKYIIENILIMKIIGTYFLCKSTFKTNAIKDFIA